MIDPAITPTITVYKVNSRLFFNSIKKKSPNNLF